MLRMFKQDVGSLFKKGDIRDYSQGTWEEIAKSSKKPLDKITESVNAAAQKGMEQASGFRGRLNKP